MACAVSGILLRGENEPENINATTYKGIINKLYCGIVGANVANITANEATENINTNVPNAYNHNDPTIGTCNTPCTIKRIDNTAAIQITQPFARIFANTNSEAPTGITNKCSIVPRSRSRITAAPTNTSVIIVIILFTCITAKYHELSPLGLKRTFTTGLAGNI